MDGGKHQEEEAATRRNSFIANGPHYEYQLDLMVIKHPEDQQYDTAMVCADAFSKYAAVIIVIVAVSMTLH